MSPIRGGSRRRTTGGSKPEVPIVRSVERVGHIMWALWHSPRGKRLADLSEELGLHKTTVLRLLRTLVAIGLVQRDEASNRYLHSPASFLRAAYSERDLRPGTGTVEGILEELAEALGMSVGLSTADLARRRVVLNGYALPGRTGHFDLRGIKSGPIHATAAGKLYLANMSQSELEEWMRGGLPKATKHTITSPQRLKEELAQVRQQGYALARQEHQPNLFAIAVPVRGAGRTTVAALVAAAPMARLIDIMIPRAVQLLRRASNRISGLLATARLKGEVG